jgi:methionine-rich copper-binding protein CopC
MVTATATPAYAHAELTASTPAKGASLAAAPARVSLTFNEPVRLGADPISVTGPGNVAWTVGKPTVAGAKITAPVQPTGPAGRYTLAYQVISADGDTVTGSVPFTLTTPAASTSTAPTTTTSTETAAPNPSRPVDSAASSEEADEGVPVWVWLVAAAALVVAAGLGALRVGRARRPD